MRTPKRKLSGTASITGEVKPSALSMALIRQFVQCVYVEKKLHIPDKVLYLN
ncbi:MAG: hypothetical protein VB074_11000 [Proteiniphilum sp.]|jgi:hypothetical protein|uniref:hypothetical protein n=1 Tax=Proteiniphilum sp. TaxID=1926877 RepID=UPI002B1ECC3F|nr:hypothetical protein [Proteiniphilum sp.]MEA5128704.1 hypothetical protein [Proteiniphilum sp.]